MFTIGSQFKLQQATLEEPVEYREYRNPVVPARELRASLDGGEFKQASDLAGELGILRARVTQLLRFL